MREFNYERAHREWAYPEWEKLSGTIKRMYKMVNEDCAELKHDKDTGLPWPFPEFKAMFHGLPTAELAHAGHVIYGLGHWDYNGAREWPRSTHGAYWKFEHYVKQVLTERGEDYAKYKPYDTKDGWMMDHKEGTELDHEEICDVVKLRVAPHFDAMKIDSANFKVNGQDGHPFVIGLKHMVNARNGVLDEKCVKSAPCAMRGCGQPYDAHTSDTVLFLQRLGEDLPEDKLTEDELKTLSDLQDLLTKHGVDGVAFVKGV